MTLLAILFLYLTTAAILAETEDQEKSPYLCYVCLGYDLDNCLSGEALCDKACMKLVDRENRVIAKGCATVDKQGGHHVLEDVKLPWANNTVVSGEMYACQKKFCNLGHSATLPFAAVLAGASAQLTALEEATKSVQQNIPTTDQIFGFVKEKARGCDEQNL
uniref:Sodefrin-like factor n=1 Tax=Romanomermis culicivorax TaxID=13658 RepID=A0A915L4D9_ROMCU